MKALVLNSGGLDSTTCVGIAVAEHGAENVSTVSVYYGQKHSKELQCAKDVADYYGVNHYELNLADTGVYNANTTCSLLSNSNVEIDDRSYAEQIKDNPNGVTTYVPFRNGLMLSAVAALAGSIYPDEEVEVFLGNHADDAAGNAYADCSAEFISYMTMAIKIGTYGKVILRSPLCNMNKAGVVKKGLELKVPYELTWSCYHGGKKQCGVCGTCLDRIEAFRKNGVQDPVEYAIDVKW